MYDAGPPQRRSIEEPAPGAGRFRWGSLSLALLVLLAAAHVERQRRSRCSADASSTGDRCQQRACEASASPTSCWLEAALSGLSVEVAPVASYLVSPGDAPSAPLGATIGGAPLRARAVRRATTPVVFAPTLLPDRGPRFRVAPKQSPPYS